MENQEILELLTLIATIFIGVVGFGFTFYQIHRSNQVKQAEFISTLLDHIRFNERVMNAVYFIDYNSNWYNEKVLSAFRAGLRTIMVPDLTAPDETIRDCLYGVAEELTGILKFLD